MALITPEQLAKGESEHSQQAAFFCWAQQNENKYPFFKKLLFAIPNGGSRGDTQRSASIIGAKMKAEGVKTGVADIMLAFPNGTFCGLYIEVKREDGGTQSQEQKEFETWAKWAGYQYVVCHGYKACVEQILFYLKNYPVA